MFNFYKTVPKYYLENDTLVSAYVGHHSSRLEWCSTDANTSPSGLINGLKLSHNWLVTGRVSSHQLGNINQGICKPDFNMIEFCFTNTINHPKREINNLASTKWQAITYTKASLRAAFRKSQCPLWHSAPTGCHPTKITYRSLPPWPPGSDFGSNYGGFRNSFRVLWSYTL